MRIVVAIAALGGCAVMIFYSELEWALECESGLCSASSRAGVLRAAAWITLASTIAAIVLDRLRIWRSRE